MKNAPIVSPAQANPALLGIVPASCSPELKMYWSGVPLGQNPPPTTGELVGSTHSSPILLMPQNWWLTFMTPNTSANRLAPRRLAPRSGAGLAVATEAPTVAASSATTTAARVARITQVERISSLGERKPSGRRPDSGAPPGAVRLEVQLASQADVPRRAVEVLRPEEQIVIGVQRLGLLRQGVGPVAVAEPRLGALQHHAVHDRRRVLVPLRAVLDVQRPVGVELAHRLRARLVGQVQELRAQRDGAVGGVDHVVRLREQAHDILEVEHVAGVYKGRDIRPA